MLIFLSTISLNAFESVFALTTLLYSLVLLRLWYVWKRMPEFEHPQGHSSRLFLSVIIPLRNEEASIEALLLDLNSQSYPADYFEVLLIDDACDDQTIAKARALQGKLNYQLRILPLKLPEGYQGSHKKQAITLAVKQAAGEVMVCTDGDCRLQKDWLKLIAGFFGTYPARFVSGGVSFHSEASWFDKLQTVEFASLIGVGAVSMALHKPNMCSAANMAFLKETFLEVKGYEQVDHIASGDDEFLLQKIYRHDRNGVYFLKASGHVVYTQPKDSLRAFYHQRKRWAGKWKLHKHWLPALLALTVFTFHAAFLYYLYGLFFLEFSSPVAIAVLLSKFMAESLFLSAVLRSLRKPTYWLYTALLQFLYSLYVIWIGLSANFGSYQWKGRKIKN